MMNTCLICETLAGKRRTPGGVIYEDDYWWIDHTLPPIFLPGKLIIKLKRHCENLAELNTDEARTLGILIQQVSQALQEVTGAEKTHVASHGEGIQHVHFLITPRTEDLPASNIRLTYWLQWRRFCYALGFKKMAHPVDQAAFVAKQVRERLSA
jgi:diadenosine tetraphosphate (Ap4A) HIT family hydrolase